MALITRQVNTILYITVAFVLNIIVDYYGVEHF